MKAKFILVVMIALSALSCKKEDAVNPITPTTAMSPKSGAIKAYVLVIDGSDTTKTQVVNVNE